MKTFKGWLIFSWTGSMAESHDGPLLNFIFNWTNFRILPLIPLLSPHKRWQIVQERLRFIQASFDRLSPTKAGCGRISLPSSPSSFFKITLLFAHLFIYLLNIPCSSRSHSPEVTHLICLIASLGQFSFYNIHQTALNANTENEQVRQAPIIQVVIQMWIKMWKIYIRNREMYYSLL